MKMKPFVEGGELPDGSRSYANGKYQVILRAVLDREGNPVVMLSLRREDRRPIFDWRDIQLVKNFFFGPEGEMVQLFPAESRLVDTSNQYFFWAYPEKVWPFGFTQRTISEGIQVTIHAGQPTVQRPFAPEHRPVDLAEQEEQMAATIKSITGRPVPKGGTQLSSRDVATILNK